MGLPSLSRSLPSGDWQSSIYATILAISMFVDVYFGSEIVVTPAAAPAVTGHITSRLSTLDRFLAMWILAAMALGLGLGRFIPGLGPALDSVQVAGVSLPIALGLLVMMYPVLAKVRYNETSQVVGDKKLMIMSLVINWLLAPGFMFALAWLFLPDLPEYRTGLIIVGLARCIAMVLIWNDLACGDREAAAVLVAINSIFQVFAFGALGWFYLQALPGWLGLPTTSAKFSIWAITLSVLVFLGIPLVAGFLTRALGEKVKGRVWYEGEFLPKLGPWALYGLLFTIAVAIATFGVTSGQALAGVVGPLIEVPLLVALVYVALWSRKFFPSGTQNVLV